MYLEQNIDYTPYLGGTFLYLFDLSHILYAVYERDKRHYLLYLVCLQWPDEVPTYIRRQDGLFGHQFLYAALAEISLSHIVSFEYIVV